MLQVYKILKGIDKLESNQFFSLGDISNTRRHSLKLLKHCSKSSLRQTIQSRMTNNWNVLQGHIIGT